MTSPLATRLTLAHIMSAHDTNLMGTVHGGHVMKLVDDAAGTVAARFSGGPAVTAAMDEMLFVLADLDRARAPECGCAIINAVEMHSKL